MEWRCLLLERCKFEFEELGEVLASMSVYCVVAMECLLPREIPCVAMCASGLLHRCAGFLHCGVL